MTAADELRLFQAVCYARSLLRRGDIVTGAAIDIAAKEFGIFDENRVARRVLEAERACEAARELMWRERQHRRGVPDEIPESSTIPSSLAMFEYV